MANLRRCVESAVDRVERDFIDHPSPLCVPFGKDHSGKDYPLKSLSEWIDDLRKRKLLRYDKRSKMISVTHNFCFGRIPKIKIIASGEEWFEIYYGIDQQTFNSIQGFLSRPKKQKREELKRYAKEDLESFREDLLSCAIAAHSINPIQYVSKGKYSPKYRIRSSAYGFSPRKKNEVSSMTVHLYVYLCNISKLPSKEWPSYVKPFLKYYHIPWTDLIRKPAKSGLKRHVVKIISKRFDFKLGERFWKTFVEEGRVKLKRVKKLRKVNPEKNPILRPLFDQFIKQSLK